MNELLFSMLFLFPAGEPVKPLPAVARVAKPFVPQEQSVVNARRARKAIAARHRGITEAKGKALFEQQRLAQERAAREYEEYVIRMGPIWAQEHANQIQQERNAMLAQANQIAKYKADYEIWLQMQSNALQAQQLQQQMQAQQQLQMQIQNRPFR